MREPGGYSPVEQRPEDIRSSFARAVKGIALTGLLAGTGLAPREAMAQPNLEREKPAYRRGEVSGFGIYDDPSTPAVEKDWVLYTAPIAQEAPARMVKLAELLPDDPTVKGNDIDELRTSEVRMSFDIGVSVTSRPDMRRADVFGIQLSYDKNKDKNWYTVYRHRIEHSEEYAPYTEYLVMTSNHNFPGNLRPPEDQHDLPDRFRDPARRLVDMDDGRFLVSERHPDGFHFYALSAGKQGENAATRVEVGALPHGLEPVSPMFFNKPR